MNPDTVRFWLENRQVYGLVNARVEGEQLVSYKNRYYVVRNNAVVIENGRLQRFTASTLPAAWKRVVNGVPQSGTLPLLDTDSTLSKSNNVTALCSTTTDRRSNEAEAHQVLDSMEDNEETERVVVTMIDGEAQGQEMENKEKEKDAPVAAKRAKKGEGAKVPKGEPVTFECPYCGHKGEAPPVRKDGRPFFTICEKCQGEYAVRLVPVTIYRAEVAAFPRKGSQS
jgi:hypothetical protein